MAVEMADDDDDDDPLADRCWERVPYHPYLKSEVHPVNVTFSRMDPEGILCYVGGIGGVLGSGTTSRPKGSMMAGCSYCCCGIQDYIISKAMCVCGVTNVLADDLLPNQTLRHTISRILESTTSSTENAGSLVHVIDMESARSIQPKVPSPTLSAASKDERKLHLLNEYTLGENECEVASEGKTENVAAHSSERKAAKVTDPSEATQDSASAKEPI